MHRFRSSRFLLVVTLLALVTAGCADTATTTTEAAATTTTAAATTTTAAAEETTTTGAPEAKGVIGFSFGNESAGIYPIIARAAAAEAERRGYELVEGSANGDCDKQVQDIEGMIASGVNALVFLPLCGVEPYANVVDQAKDAGITVVGYSTAIPGSDAAIVYDNITGAESIAHEAIRWFNEDFTGNKDAFTWALFTFDQCGRACTERTDTIRSVIVEELGIEPLEAEAVAEDTGLEATETFLQGTPTLNMLIGINDAGALGGYQAFVNQIEQEGRDPGEIFVGGMDGQNEALELIAEGGGPHGIYRACSALLTYQVGQAVADLPANILEGQPTNSLLLNYELLTPADPARAQEILDTYASLTG
ncbi:MAG TPA: sugar ABC transporter substrate-binding protein [Acidimicrobiia bacterium]|nr:sugar ABC transporter substrate-binding protein [Acidimicrobiia bacterium]